MPDPWVYGAYSVPAGDEALAASDFPEEQDDVYVEETPQGATASDSTIVQFIHSPSRQIILRHYCTEATKNAIVALKRTTFVLKTPFDTTGISVYLKRVDARLWTSSQGFVPDRWHVTAWLVER